ATIPGFLSRGLSLEEGESLLKKSVKLAVEARDKFWDGVGCIPGNSYNRALVAASIGRVNLDKLKDFHRRRLQVIVEAGPDLLAFETIPNKLEAQACVELLEEENIQIPSWICFSSVDGENAPSGESFKECFEILNKSKKVNAVGINCASPHFIESLVCKFKELTTKAIVVYPNSGAIWDGRAKKWLPSMCFGDEEFELCAPRWRNQGAKVIG
ncbi:hypothetical protein Goarm_013411, partial [Gossypium armourianum]|nr:hypothetical protein [Gossypium armourianum]